MKKHIDKQMKKMRKQNEVMEEVLRKDNNDLKLDIKVVDDQLKNIKSSIEKDINSLMQNVEDMIKNQLLTAQN